MTPTTRSTTSSAPTTCWEGCTHTARTRARCDGDTPGCETRDFAKPRPHKADSAFLGRLVTRSPNAGVTPGRVRRLMTLAAEPLFEAFHELGASLRASSHAGLRGYLRVLGDIDHSRSLLAEVALGAGALASSPRGMPVAFERLAEAWA